MKVTKGHLIILICLGICLSLYVAKYRYIIAQHHTTATQVCSSHLIYVTNNTIELNVDGDLNCLLGAYNNEISAFRESILHKNYTTLHHGEKTFRAAIGNWNCKDCDHFGIIDHYDQVTTMKLTWKILSKSNATMADYPLKYHYVSAFPPKAACSAKNISTECAYHISSQINLTKSFSVLPNPKSFANQGYPKHIFFIHIIRGGQIDDNGNVRTGKLDIIPFQCQEKAVHLKPTTRFADEVFVISQFWGYGFFHATIECLPRIMPYFEFLRSNPSIYIHGSVMVKSRLQFLGLDPKRMITGNVKAKNIYLPQGSGCSSSLPIQLQLLHQKFQNIIKVNNMQNGPRNIVVQIFRSRRRFIVEKNEVSALLKKYSSIYKFTYVKFKDNPSPSFNETVSMFARARLIVAPHGAGLSNMLFSQPGTRVIEILQSNKVNGCYYKLHKILAQPYVGLMNRRRNNDVNLSVDVAYLEKLIEQTMKAIRMEK